MNKMLLAKEGQKSEEQMQGCLTPGHTARPHQVPQIRDLNTLCKDSSTPLLVEQRLKQLADTEKTGTKIKSLRGG